jgi:hypothetical protein
VEVAPLIRDVVPLTTAFPTKLILSLRQRSGDNLTNLRFILHRCVLLLALRGC